MTTQAERDAALRAQPLDYVDPLHKRAKAHKRRPRRTAPRTRPSGPPSDPTSVMRAEGDRYPMPMKMGLMLLAVQSSVSQVAADFKIREKTIYGWFEHAGGLNNVRAYAKAAAENSFATLHREMCDEIRSRMKEATDEELFESYRKLMDTADKVGLSEVTQGEKGAGVSGVHPGSVQAPPINLIFNAPTPLPPGSESQGNVTPSDVEQAGAAPPEDVVEGEVVEADVFDDA